MNLLDTITCLKYSQLPRRFFVEFALSCANETRSLLNREALIKALDLVALWLEDKATKQEVKAMADTHIFYLYSDSTYSKYAVISTICATYYIDFITTTYHSAYNAAKAINYDNSEIKEQEYAQRFLDKINALTKVEKALYGVD